MKYVIGVDVGGTYTDAVLHDGAQTVLAAKSPSTPPGYTVGVLQALALLAEQLDLTLPELLAQTRHIAHGTTWPLNTLVTGNVPPVGFITTQGHRDSIFIMNVEGRYLGRGAQELQDPLRQNKNHSLLPKRHAVEVIERIDRDGNVVVRLDEEHARSVIRSLIDDGIKAIAISLLWSFRNPIHEQRLRELVAQEDPSVFVALSSTVSPRIREFARNATTIMSAQIAPGLRDYVNSLQSELRANRLAGPLLIMQSDGGAVAAEFAPDTAISTVGSILTGGVVGAVALGRKLGHRNIVSTDVGGTTFLTGLVVDGRPVRETTTVINHHPVNVPGIRVQAIGSGGGAVAWLDSGGNLRVGPRSAQAVPGPACYANGGTEPTVTDANLVLGILPEHGLLGGRQPLSMEAARHAIETSVAKPLGLSVEHAAAAIYTVQNAQTGDLVRKTVVESGYDPREFVLYAFGGAGPAHCARYAAEIGIDRIVVPLGQIASAFSAYGLAASNLSLVLEHSDPAAVPVDPVRAERVFADLERRVHDGLHRQGTQFGSIEMSREIDMRYSMQMAEVTTPVPAGPMDSAVMEEVVAAFEERYRALYGADTGFREAGIQAITFRVRGVGVLPMAPELPPVAAASSSDPASARVGRRPVCLDASDGYLPTPVYDYRLLRAGHSITGPAIVEVPTTTVVVPAFAQADVDTWGNLLIHRTDIAGSES